MVLTPMISVMEEKMVFTVVTLPWDIKDMMLFCAGHIFLVHRKYRLKYLATPKMMKTNGIAAHVVKDLFKKRLIIADMRSSIVLIAVLSCTGGRSKA